ncbi:MAG: hypothetical protein QM764_10105 [Chitinophagaceae bacterium]
MNLSKICIPLLVFITLFISCQKEISSELDKNAATGSLQSDVDGSCLSKNVQGAFIASTALASTNYIEVNVNVTTAGSYFISTDTLNGYYFRGTGNFTVGTNTIKLTASGTPLAAGTNNFFISFDSSSCYVPVTVLPAGTSNAVFTLSGAGSACMNSVVAGTYAPGVALTADNKVTIEVNVSTIGTYSITTTAVNGMTFSGTGVLTATGTQHIVLTGTGTPVNAESSVISITAGSSSCTFTIKVEDPSLADYFPRTVNSFWTYSVDGDMSDTIRHYVIPQTLTAAGNTYAIFLEDDGTSVDTAGSYRKAANEYHVYYDFGSLVGLDNPQSGDAIFLKDNVPSGTTWTSDAFAGTAGGLPVSIRARFTITKKDETVTANGVPYPNTIAVKNTFEVNLGTGWTDYSSFTGYTITYFSRNVGLIKTETYDASNAITETDDLIKYQVF